MNGGFWFLSAVMCAVSMGFSLGGVLWFAISALYDLGNERYSLGFGLGGCALIFLGFIGMSISGFLR